MTLKEILQKIGQRHGVEQLNPMQKAVTQCKANRIVLLAPTGSGKTLAFTVPMIERLNKPQGTVQALIIAPSRELVIQITEVIRSVAIGYKVSALYGGHSMQDEINTLQQTPDIIVATPGRLLDHVQRDTIDISNITTLVLDEYDKSLELGFQDQMRRIVRRCKKAKYIMLTSATPLDEYPDFIDLSQAKVIDFSEKAQSPRSRMTVALVKSPERDKIDTLHTLLDALPNGKVIVFVNHRESAERVYQSMKKSNLPVGLYHGGLDQLHREIAIDMLNNGTTPILISTDLASRGLDIDAVRSVVHYHMPLSKEAWTHRNGRTARVNSQGYVYLIASDGENIPDYVDYDFEYIPDPDNPDPICSDSSTLYFNAGKKEKISKGDILGFLTKQCAITASQIGKIIIKDHCSIVSVPTEMAESIVEISKANKVKGQRVKVTIFR